MTFRNQPTQKYKATSSWKGKRQKHFRQVVDHVSIHFSPNLP